MLLTRPPLVSARRPVTVRLACLKHTASVQSEPGSNSSVQSLRHISLCTNSLIGRATFASLLNYVIELLRVTCFLWQPPSDTSTHTSYLAILLNIARTFCPGRGAYSSFALRRCQGFFHFLFSLQPLQLTTPLGL